MPRTAMDPEAALLKKFEKIDQEWRDTVSAMPVDELKAQLIQVTKNEHENQAAKEQDEDLEQRKRDYEFAASGYKDATQINKLKLKFLVRHLKAKNG
jgi:hypothetical protein